MPDIESSTGWSKNTKPTPPLPHKGCMSVFDALEQVEKTTIESKNHLPFSQLWNKHFQRWVIIFESNGSLYPPTQLCTEQAIMFMLIPNTLHKLLTAMGGITAQRFPNVIVLSHNVRGYSSKQSSSKKDHIIRILKAFIDTPSILFTQETWSDNDTNLEIENILFFSHGAQPNNCTKGGVGIVLPPLAIQAWKLAGQPEPIPYGKIAAATQIMALELQF
jgi:hypothetical protein